MDCKTIGTLTTGEIDCNDLRNNLIINKDKPAIINLTIGTTFKGGIDNLDLVLETLEECGFSKDRFYIHCDAALYGLISPFAEKDPMFSFNKPIGSVSVSAHKLLGSPMPCGVLIARKKYTKAVTASIECISTLDNTISGSRNGHAPIFMWYTISMKGQLGIEREVKNCLTKAQYFRDLLKNAGISNMLNDMSIIVVFERPLNREIIEHWQIACEGNLAHVVVMPHITTKMLDDFVEDLVRERTILREIGKIEPPCLANDIGTSNCACLIHG
ncbi:Serine decarboxylase [Striga hermonthica]|uniref:Serine decarboxylase n=1 Tax=Striga hermonthica TaxID=68872 RepID=A0A9N7RNI9_STRHE|nr:Serine decarboxylase [Striga hermonthica]